MSKRLHFIKKINLNIEFDKFIKFLFLNDKKAALQKLFIFINAKISQSPLKKTFFEYKKFNQNYDSKILDENIIKLLNNGLFESKNNFKKTILYLNSLHKNEIIAEAENILKNKYTIYGDFNITFEKNKFTWLLDPLTDFEWPIQLNSFDFTTKKNTNADIKNIWEIARFQFLFFLSYAYIITNNRKYPLFAIEKINSWIDENQFLCGPHWSRSIESSIRIINWCFFLPLLNIFKFAEPKFISKLSKSFLSHFVFIKNNLERTLLHKNNHYLTGLVGMMLGRVIFPSIEETIESYVLAKIEFKKEVNLQFKKSGINFEGSLPYHRFSSEILFFGAALIQFIEKELPENILKTLKNVHNFNQFYSCVTNEIPIIGDNDSGILIKYFYDQEKNNHQYLNYLIYYLYIKIFNENNNNNLLHLFQQKAQDQIKKQSKILLNNIVSMPKIKEFDGLVIAKSKNDALFFNTLDSYEGHRHNDSLSIYPVIDGQLVFIDRGSFSYTGNIEKRFNDRKTFSHNCPVIMNWEQNRIWKNELFYISKNAKCERKISYKKNILTIIGSQNGYSRYNTGLKIFREIKWNFFKKTMLISDWADRNNRNKKYNFTWNFLINPIWDAKIVEGVLVLQFENIKILIKNINKNEIKLENSYYSPYYQIEKHCKALRASCALRVGEKMHFLMHYN